MVRFFSKKNESGLPLDSKRNALDGLLGKLDSQLNSERQFKRSSRSDPIIPSGINQGSALAGNPLVSPNRMAGNNPFQQIQPIQIKPKKAGLDPKTMKTRVRRNQIRANVLARHRGGNYSSNTDPDYEIGGEVEAEFNDDDDLKVVDEGGYKTMEWTEPDGSITILKFDEDGALIGKEKKSKKKQRPEKFQQDLKDKLEAEERKQNRQGQRAVASAQFASGNRPSITQQQASLKDRLQGTVSGE